MLSPHQYRVTARHCPSSSTILLKITLYLPQMGTTAYLALTFRDSLAVLRSQGDGQYHKDWSVLSWSLTFLIRPAVFILKLRPLKF